MQNNQDLDVCFLPGWMYDASNYGFANRVRLWQTPFNEIQPVSVKTLIGYSLGGNLALRWFLEGESERLIKEIPVLRDGDGET